MSPTVMLVAGEASGDLHGARMLRELRTLVPDLRCVGMGGQHLRAAGMQPLVDADRLAVVGLVEVLRHWGDIQAALRTLREHIEREPPDLLVLIDYVEFNLRLARHAKAAGVKVLFYISPQVWAWRPHRVKVIGERVDHMAVVFPFEVPFYERAGIPVTYVGHPLANAVHASMPREEARRSFGLDPDRPVVGLFPGSRRSEIHRLLPLMLDVAARLHAHDPGRQFLLPVASTLEQDEIAPRAAALDLPVTVVDAERFYDVIECCDAIATASGTATLEVALMGRPMAIVYKVAPLSYAIMRRMVRVDHIGLANIVAGGRVVREFLQQEARPEAVAAELERLLTDPDYAATVISGLRRVRERIGTEDGSHNVAVLAADMLGLTPPGANPSAATESEHSETGDEELST